MCGRRFRLPIEQAKAPAPQGNKEMSPGILGKKIGMTQVFRPDGQVVPVTLLKAGPCMVV